MNHALTATINTVLSIYLTIKIGYYGALIAIVISYMIASLHLDISLRKILGVKAKEYASNIPILFVMFTVIVGLGMHLLIKIYIVQWNAPILVSLVLAALLVNILLYLLTRNDHDKVFLSYVVSAVNNFRHAYSNNKA